MNLTPPSGRRCMGRSSRLARLAAGALVSALAGCASDPTQGYAAGATFRHDIRSVSVPIFENASYEHGLEMRLTESISKEIMRSTPWAVVPSDQAETTLSGSITEVKLRKLNVARTTGLTEELAVDIAVSFQWTDNRTGKILTARRNFRGSAAFAPTFGEGERLGTGEQGAVEALAHDIVAEMRSDW